MEKGDQKPEEHSGPYRFIYFLSFMNYPFIFVVNFRQQIISVSEDGPVEGAADTFKGVQKADDYHSEMNSAHN